MSGLVGLALTAIVVALAMARFIARPIRRLAERARPVSAGHLDVGFGLAGSPKETAVVSRAFDELVSNLQLLERKSQALASCDFTNPVLSQPLPGRLGASIQSWVRIDRGARQAASISTISSAPTTTTGTISATPFSRRLAPACGRSYAAAT